MWASTKKDERLTSDIWKRGAGKLGVGEAGNAGLNTGDGERELKRWTIASSMHFPLAFAKLLPCQT